MIRQATKYDKKQIIEMMKGFYEELQFETEIALDNEQYYDNVLTAIFAGRGIIYIIDNVGLIIGIVNPSFFDPKTLALNCVAWAVKPKYRNKTYAYRLLKAYTEYAEGLVQEGRIKYYTLGKTPKTPDMDYTKLGFRKTDEVWVK
jgi:N-acetylglutamate synthase-like GNAT family acetyltransferase